MPIALSAEHEALRLSARRWLTSHCPPSVPRALLDAEVEELQPVWAGVATQGWLGLHLPEEFGGQGFGLFELAVILEETGWSVLPGPLLPTVAASALLAEALAPLASRLLPGLIDGSRVGAVAFRGHCLEVIDRRRSGDVVVSGTVRPVVGGALASVILAPAREQGGGVIWCLMEVDRGDPAVKVTPLSSLDATRRVASVEATAYTVPAGHVLTSLRSERVDQVLLALMAAEHVGGARWCLETATAYAKVRVQFGRPIGQFQAVKHRLADMAVRVEQMTAAAWDAAVAVAAGEVEGAALAAATAGALCMDGYAECAKECMQLLGGIGFTWDHEVHLHLKRALAGRQLAGGSERLCRQVAEVARRGARRTLATDLPEEADRWRAELGPIFSELQAVTAEERRAIFVDAGLVVPHWPRPWGRDASAVEQVVIDELLAESGVDRPYIAVGAWALPVVIAYGTEDQTARWVRPTLMGELTWCQLFSEPGAGSDLASLTTRAERSEGGWNLSGQKVWTSMAHVADWGICLARTDPSAAKHDGITYFIVDMHAPGVDIRPLRELTGAALFNEVFLDAVFVPDDCVIGEVNRGWGIARVTLANERVFMSSGSAFGVGAEALLRLAAKMEDAAVADVSARLGSLLAEAQSLRLMAHRSTLMSLAGADPGAVASLRKLLGAEHEQRVQELGLAMLGSEGATTEGRAARWAAGVLATRCLTIAGGTSEVQRNVIAERILGLPRDPEPAG